MSNISFKPYTGPWEKRNALHLLNRTVFGYKLDDLKESEKIGLGQTIEALFEVKPLPPPPIHYTFDQEPKVPLGQTWVMTKQPSPNVAGLNFNRKKSLRAWQMGLFNETGMHIREKMVMFWHDHLPISAEGNARFEYQYVNLLRTHALGNFKTLVTEMTICPAMLKYLNGNENGKEAPNENYSRELLELFTVGRGQEQGNGDYTNYTEKDVLELARSLTGWRLLNQDGELPKGRFVNNQHDVGEKTLSTKFGSQVISNEGSLEYKTTIELIFQNNEVARFISRKLHVWFLDSKITSEVEANIIEPMASMIVDDNYEISNALKAFLSSEYFNDVGHHGCMITSPYDYMFKVINTLDVELNIDLDAKYFFWDKLQTSSTNLQMVFLDVPSVAGWKAFYQAPQYYKYWINSVTLIERNDFLNLMKRGITISGKQFGLDYLRMLNQVEEPSDPNKLIQELVDLFYAVPISEKQFIHLKRGLLLDEEDDLWTREYNQYLENPTNQSNLNKITERLDNFFWRFLRTPEFQLM